MFALPEDPYEALGVPPDSQLPVIRTAYRKLVLKYHPDKVQNEAEKAKAQETFQKVQRAWELVSDELERNKYDDKVKANKLEEEKCRLMRALREKLTRGPARRAATFHDIPLRPAEVGLIPPLSARYGSFPPRTSKTQYDRSHSSSREDIYVSEEFGRSRKASRDDRDRSSREDDKSQRQREAEKRAKLERKDRERREQEHLREEELRASRTRREEKESQRRKEQKDSQRRKEERRSDRDRKREMEGRRTYAKPAVEDDSSDVSRRSVRKTTRAPAREAPKQPTVELGKDDTDAEYVELRGEKTPRPGRRLSEYEGEKNSEARYAKHLTKAAEYMAKKGNNLAAGLKRTEKDFNVRHGAQPPVPSPPPLAAAGPRRPMASDMDRDDSAEDVLRRSSARSSRIHDVPRSQEKPSSSYRKASSTRTQHADADPFSRGTPPLRKAATMPTEREASYTPTPAAQSRSGSRPPRFGMHRSSTSTYESRGERRERDHSRARQPRYVETEVDVSNEPYTAHYGRRTSLTPEPVSARYAVHRGSTKTMPIYAEHNYRYYNGPGIRQTMPLRPSMPVHTTYAADASGSSYFPVKVRFQDYGEVVFSDVPRSSEAYHEPYAGYPPVR